MNSVRSILLLTILELILSPITHFFGFAIEVDSSSPNIVTLDDDSFEHLTQATTGSTAGDWFVLFYSASSPSNEIVHHVWNKLAALLKDLQNVAEVDYDKNPKLQKRFELKAPTAYLFRHGNQYQYTLPLDDLESLKNFATEQTEKIQGYTINSEQKLYSKGLSWIKHYKKQIQVLAIAQPIECIVLVIFGIALGLMIAPALLYKRNHPPIISKSNSRANRSKKDY